MATFLTTPQSVSLSGLTANTWTTFTSGAPAGTTGVILNFYTATGNSSAITTRMTNGSPDTQTNAVVNGSGCQMFSVTGVNSSGQFDLFATVTNTLTCWLVGYFGAEATFFANATVLSPTLTSSYQNFNVSATSPSALVVFVDCFASGGQLFFRQNGSTDTENYFGGQSFMCGVDGSGIFNAKNGNTGGTLYVKGYMTGGVVWHTNMLSVGGSFSAGSFQNISQGAGDPTGIAQGYSYFTNGNNKYTLCGSGCNTSTYNPQSIPVGTGGGQSVYGGPAPAQINPASATQVLNETAFFTSPQIVQSPWQLYGIKSMVAQ